MRRPFVIGAAVCGLVMVLFAAVLVLRPDVRNYFEYQVAADGLGAPESTSPLPPIAPSTPAPVRIAVVGDVGTGGDAEYRTAAAIDELETELDYDALVMLGDNVYPNGDPDELQRTVFEPFADVLDNGTLLLAVLGNHDVRDDNGDAHAAAIGMPARWYATELDDVLIVSLDSTRPDDPDQLAWLEATLENADTTWIVATMHHPPYSGGYHGSSRDVRDAFSPIFERHGVQIVLAGHDHDYQRSETVNGVTYIVSGGAAKLRPANKADFTAVAWSTHHFVDLVVTPDRMEIRAVNQTGDLFDSITLTP